MRARGPDTRLGRRGFLMGLGIAGAVSAFGAWLTSVGSREAMAQTPAPAPPPPPAPEVQAEADAWLAIVRARVGTHLKKSDESALREEFLNAIPGSKALRARTLPNGLDPDTVFRARELDT